MMTDLSLPDRYEPKDNSASGGFSNVQICLDTHLQRDVAVKTIKDASESGRIQDELKALMQLRSKHVVQVFDIANYENDKTAIVMEYISGSDLFNYDLDAFSPEDFLKLLWQLSSGITDIHAAGIIHRDLKPNNMKIDDEGILKIFDFGLSRNSEDASTVGFKGTIGFAAPEQFTNGHLQFSDAVDVYAFGAIALFLLTNDLPDELKSIPPEELLESAFDNTLVDQYPKIKEYLVKCLSIDPVDRPKISDVHEQLTKFLLYNEHQALAVAGVKSHVIDKNKKKVSVKSDNIGAFAIEYDGFEFRLVNPQGEVFLNNSKVTGTLVLPGSCVVALGASHRTHYERSYVTFDISNPEVSL
ncbi:MAG: serine/threonine protein kinase [Alteromonadaceae bacterium]|nr:serine/threonine protein kinase [Alteromonadaceae bacterium]